MSTPISEKPKTADSLKRKIVLNSSNTPHTEKYYNK